MHTQIVKTGVITVKKNVYRNSLSIDSLYFTEVMYKNTEEMSICET